MTAMLGPETLSALVDSYVKAPKGDLRRALLLALDAGYDFERAVRAMGDVGVQASFACILEGWIDRGQMTEAGRAWLRQGAES